MCSHVKGVKICHFQEKESYFLLTSSKTCLGSQILFNTKVEIRVTKSIFTVFLLLGWKTMKSLFWVMFQKSVVMTAYTILFERTPGV